MTPRQPLPKRPARLAMLVIVSAVLAAAAFAQSTRTASPAVATKAEEGPRWQDLSAAQRTSLKPLERQWSGIDAPRKQKWIEIAVRYPNLPRTEQDRISERMTAWAKMSPAERGQARLNFQEARQITPQERQARWEAYQALPADQRRQLAARATPTVSAPRATEAVGKGTNREAGVREGAQAKSNIVPNPAHAARPRAVAPTVVQARPGVTTSLVSQRPAPPTHQQPGLPKIAGSPGFVDKATLLPQRGPQGAATSPQEAKTPSDRAPAR